MRPVLISHNGHEITARQQFIIVRGLLRRKERGATSREVEKALDIRGGAYSGAFSTLTEQGVICQLAEKRKGCRIYVLPEYVNGRETIPVQKHHCPGCRCFDTPEDDEVY